MDPGLDVPQAYVALDPGLDMPQALPHFPSMEYVSSFDSEATLPIPCDDKGDFCTGFVMSVVNVV